jgi:hypothetical protein
MAAGEAGGDISGDKPKPKRISASSGEKLINHMTRTKAIN